MGVKVETVTGQSIAAGKSKALLVGKPAGRFTFIDGLRGIAALAVTLFHLGPMAQFGTALPAAITTLLGLGFLGVPVFFVLSGFVIAYSQRSIRVTSRFLGKFALRRSIRLDPPYWAAIILVLTVNAILNPTRPGQQRPFPGGKIILAHLFYLQDLFRLPEINGTFWTLCYEVQFYIVFTILKGLVQRLYLRFKSLNGAPQPWYLGVFIPVAILSLLVSSRCLSAPHGLFIDKWYAFFLGALLWAAMEGSVSINWFWAYLAIMFIAIFSRPGGNISLDDQLWVVIAMATGVSIYLAHLNGRMERWLSNRWIQFFGRISYSLYLVHLPVGTLVDSLALRYHRPSNIFGLIVFAISMCASIGVAYLLYLLVELPAMRVAKRIKYE